MKRSDIGYHLCRGETVRPYPKVLCSLCSSCQEESRDFDAIDYVGMRSDVLAMTERARKEELDFAFFAAMTSNVDDFNLYRRQADGLGMLMRDCQTFAADLARREEEKR